MFIGGSLSMMSRFTHIALQYIICKTTMVKKSTIFSSAFLFRNDEQGVCPVTRRFIKSKVQQSNPHFAKAVPPCGVNPKVKRKKNQLSFFQAIYQISEDNLNIIQNFFIAKSYNTLTLYRFAFNISFVFFLLSVTFKILLAQN